MTSCLRWDIFCHVVDNFGDIGTCWRLARQLAVEHSALVRLWVDDLASFSHLHPEQEPGFQLQGQSDKDWGISVTSARQFLGPIQVCHWPSDFPAVDVADVVIEAFACEIPESYRISMANRQSAPVWINLEYLSAEDWVAGCHLLKSPPAEDRLAKRFFFPGFTSETGGLIHERDLLTRRAAFDSATESEFWRSIGLPSRQPDELRISLFCYHNPGLFPLLREFAASPLPVRVCAMPGPATTQLADLFGLPTNQLVTPGTRFQHGSLTVHVLPFLPQSRYDLLLWACDVNFVRGEDSFVRAQWAQRPFLWQVYPQSDDVHIAKLQAFLLRYLAGYEHADVVRRCFLAWNGRPEDNVPWRNYLDLRNSLEIHGRDWANRLDHAGNLANNLSALVRGQ